MCLRSTTVKLVPSFSSTEIKTFQEISSVCVWCARGQTCLYKPHCFQLLLCKHPQLYPYIFHFRIQLPNCPCLLGNASFLVSRGVNHIPYGSLTRSIHCDGALPPSVESHGSHFVPKCPCSKAWLRIHWNVCHPCLSCFVCVCPDCWQCDGKRVLWGVCRPVARTLIWCTRLIPAQRCLSPTDIHSFPLLFFLFKTFCEPVGLLLHM